MNDNPAGQQMSSEAVEGARGIRIQASCWAALFVRLSLAAAFLSAVADRFGLWGTPGAEGVAWGSVENYETYVGILIWYMPTALIPVFGWIATLAEISIAGGLIVGWQVRWIALAAGLLLTMFALAMFTALGPKPPLDYSVLSAASAAFLLFTVSDSHRTI